MAKFAVKLHRPWQWASTVSVLSMTIAVLTWLVLDHSHWRYIEDKLTGSQDYKMLWEVNQELEKENITLRDRVVMLEQTTDIDKKAAGVVQDEMKKLQDDIHDFKGELQFYRDIMDSASTANGLDVQGIYIKPLQPPGRYRLKLVLTHVGKTGTVLEGLLDVRLEGQLNGSAKTLRLEDISLGQDIKFAYSFRNFQRFQTNFLLPEDFVPQRVSVNLLYKNKKGSRLKKAFDWSESTTER